MLCPHCNATLLMTDRQGIEIDYCPKCRGIWLDRGELEKLIERSFQVDRQPQSEGFKRTEPQRHEDTYRQDDDRDYRRSEAPYYHHRKKRESWFSELFDFD